MFCSLAVIKRKIIVWKVRLKTDKVNTFVYCLRHFYLRFAHIASFGLRYYFQRSFVKLREQTKTLFLVSHQTPCANAVNQRTTGKACAFLSQHEHYARIIARKLTRNIQPKNRAAELQITCFFLGLDNDRHLPVYPSRCER